MTTELRTARLVLRSLRSDDAGAIAAALSDWEVTRRLAAPPWPYRFADAEDFLASPLSRDSRAIDAAGQLVGVIGFDDNELGYWLSRPAWGRGYATEAAAAMVDHAFVACDWDHLVSGYQKGNLASARVLEKLGFVRVGEEMRHSAPNGQFLPSVVVRLTRAFWQARRKAEAPSQPVPRGAGLR